LPLTTYKRDIFTEKEMTMIKTKNRNFKALALPVLLAANTALVIQETEAATVYENFTLLDPWNTSVTENAYLVVEDNLIVAIGAGTAPIQDEWDYQDMSGTYALPGFFDAHGHITAGALTITIEDGVPMADMSSVENLTRFHALEALAYGVTTLRNPAGDPVANHQYNQKVEQGEWIGPEALHAGFSFEPTPIRGGTFYPKTEAEWKAEIAREKALGMQYIKLYTGLSEEEVELGIKLAHEQGMKTIAHLDKVSWLDAIDFGIDALTHALPTSAGLLKEDVRQAYAESRNPLSSAFMYQWFEQADYKSEPIQTLVSKLVENQVQVDLTLLVNEIVYFFDDIDTVITPEDRLHFHPAMMKDWDNNMAASHYGWTDADYQRAHAVFPKVLAFAKLLHDAGVPMLVGTDSAGGGPSYPRELMLHGQAGISNWDVLRMATNLSAERLGLSDRTGFLQTGLEADIVFLNSNPLLDLRNAGDVHTTVVNGTAYEVAELLDMRKQFSNPQ
jgi:imidazolonepropionase-like amidohydrolase